MDIAPIVTDDYVTFQSTTPVSQLAGTFQDTSIRGALISDQSPIGIVTRRQLVNSHHHPETTVGTLSWNCPRLAVDEDIRQVAQLMVENDTHLLPVYEDGRLEGVVTARDICNAVKPHLDVVTVEEVFTTPLKTIDVSTSIGQALNTFREHRITHLPVMDAGAVTAILSIHDVLGLTIRAEHRSQGGDPDGVDAFGGRIADSAASTRGGGYGAREGDRTRMHDTPVRDVTSTPVHTIEREATLDQAVDRFDGIEGSSLVVDADSPVPGILTITDIIDALTWETSETRPVQIYGVDHLGDISYDEIIAIVERVDSRDAAVRIVDAKVHVSAQSERHRGTPLIHVNFRLDTDRGLFIASAEGYGARAALKQARDILDRQLRDRKTYDRTKKPPDPEFVEQRYGWVLNSPF